jgi:CDP-diacylglycerol---serine O-phosphatidyltransferase
VPRTPWRRRVTNSPRPGGRRITRGLRRGGSLARRVLVGRTTAGRVTVGGGAPLHLPAEPPRDGLHRAVGTLAPPVSTEIDGDDYRGPDSPVRLPDGDSGPRPPLPSLSPVPVAGPLLPGPQTAGRRLAFVAVNGCTVASLLLGMTAIAVAIDGHHLSVAALCLVCCVAFDGLDGGLARLLGVTSPFGAQLDSMADMCSFGVATPVVAYQWLSTDAPRVALAPVCALVAVCAAIRLARFNVSPKDGRYFSGIPTTIVAAILALACLLRPDHGTAAVVSLGVLGLLMVTTFPYAKLAQLRRLPPLLLAVPVSGLLVDATWTFLALVAVYLASGPVLWLKQRRAGTLSASGR